MILLILLSLVAFTQQCCMPNQYEGFEEIMMGSVGPGGSKATLFKQSINFSYNAIRKMVYAYGTTEINNGEKVHFKVLQDYNKNVSYIIVNGNCKKSPLPDFINPCFIQKFKPVRKGYIGADKGKKDIAVYEIPINGMMVSLSVDDKCIVIDLAFYAVKGQSVGSTRVSNVTLGIKDPSVFNVPSICQNERSYHFSNKFVKELHKHHTKPLQPLSMMTGHL